MGTKIDRRHKPFQGKLQSKGHRTYTHINGWKLLCWVDIAAQATAILAGDMMHFPASEIEAVCSDTCLFHLSTLWWRCRHRDISWQVDGRPISGL